MSLRDGFLARLTANCYEKNKKTQDSQLEIKKGRKIKGKKESKRVSEKEIK